MLSKNGVNCFIFQNSFLGDRQATKLRYDVLSNNKILNIDSYPERDSKKKRVFESVKMSVCIVLVQKSKVSSNYYFPVNIWDDKETTTGIHTSFSFDEICSIDKVDYTIPRIRQEDKALVIKLIEKKEIVIKCIEGELNMTLHKKYFTNQESYPLILKGAAIQRYFYTKQMSQGKIEYLDEERYLQDCGNTEKSRHHNLDRIVMQGMTGANDKIRLVMTIIPKGFYLANSCNYILPTDNIDIYCLLGILNSKLMNWFFRCFSTNSNVNGYEIDNFPIPQLDNQLQNKISQLVLQILHQSNVSQIKIKEIEKQIDIIVYKIYKLNSDEIKLITES